MISSPGLILPSSVILMAAVQNTNCTRTCWTKTETTKGSNLKKSFVEFVGMNGSNFKNKTLFLSFAARNGWDSISFPRTQQTILFDPFIVSFLFLSSMCRQKRWLFTFSLHCLCSSTSHLFTSRLRLIVYWSTINSGT